ncbi:hypothetical protein HPB49_015397 [Dermacentor silvarum]|uniref:Uncharacterized protein n=1 Tax=Dermacentor silvarum TaxID=543639 RepID=A0ACB8CRL6_DERSI|nr:hypothetical protein HPB49_015397 [Dermacentor silvarum]
MTKGVNFDWNHPEDECDVLKQPQLFHVLVGSLVKQLRDSSREGDALTVPPLQCYVGPYDLQSVLDSVEHVVVATHKLRPRSSVDCSGARLYAAPSFREIRSTYNDTYRKKFAYSISRGYPKGVCSLEGYSHVRSRALFKLPCRTTLQNVCLLGPIMSLLHAQKLVLFRCGDSMIEHQVFVRGVELSLDEHCDPPSLLEAVDSMQLCSGAARSVEFPLGRSSNMKS